MPANANGIEPARVCRGPVQLELTARNRVKEFAREKVVASIVGDQQHPNDLALRFHNPPSAAMELNPEAEWLPSAVRQARSSICQVVEPLARIAERLLSPQSLPIED